MARSIRKEVRRLPRPGTKIPPYGHKNQGYQLPLPLWQDLKVEAARRKVLGLSFDSQQAIAEVVQRIEEVATTPRSSGNVRGETSDPLISAIGCTSA